MVRIDSPEYQFKADERAGRIFDSPYQAVCGDLSDETECSVESPHGLGHSFHRLGHSVSRIHKCN